MKKLFGLLVLVFLFAALGVRLYQELWNPAGSAQADFPNRRPALLVSTAVVTPHTFRSSLEIMGELKPYASVEVMSRISGYLQEVTVERADAVREGQLLARVDDLELRQQIRRAEAGIAVAEARMERERALYENLQKQVERFRQLHAQKLISDQDLEDLLSQGRAAEAALALAEAQVEQEQATLQELREREALTRIYAPFDGWVGARHLDPGALVNPNQAILTILDVSRLRTVVSVPDVHVPLLKVGLPATIQVDAFPQDRFQARITRISPVVDLNTRAAEVELEIPNREGRLKPGMFARVRLELGTQKALGIPRSALVTQGTRKGVFRISESSTALFQPIQVGRVDGEVVEVVEGLAEGDTVISRGAQNLNEGDPVRLP